MAPGTRRLHRIFGHSGGVAERVGDALAERRTEFCGLGCRVSVVRCFGTVGVLA